MENKEMRITGEKKVQNAAAEKGEEVEKAVEEALFSYFVGC